LKKNLIRKVLLAHDVSFNRLQSVLYLMEIQSIMYRTLFAEYA